METLKNEIKQLAEYQRVLRDQRKSVNNKLDRTIEPREAQWKHKAHRDKLRILYAAQAILRGKTIEQVHAENPTKEQGKPTILDCKVLIEKIVELHKDEQVVHISE
jgi:hypothetical protein